MAKEKYAPELRKEVVINTSIEKKDLTTFQLENHIFPELI